MTDLSHADRAKLSGRASIARTPHCLVFRSADDTRKLVLKLEDGLEVEAVLIPDESRLTLCVSTQVGCTLDCGFCLTGTMGLKRNLKPHEIIDQVLAAQDQLEDGERLSNIVFMGMGEPLANFDAMSEAIRRLTNKRWGLGWSPRRITVSTAGLASRMKEVAPLGVNLAVSLNATTDEQRARLMPAVNGIASLKSLLLACRRYPLAPHRRLTFEYVLLAGVNDGEADALRLVKLIRGITMQGQFDSLQPISRQCLSPAVRPRHPGVPIDPARGRHRRLHPEKSWPRRAGRLRTTRESPDSHVRTLTHIESRC